MTKNKIWKNKSGYNRTNEPWDPREKTGKSVIIRSRKGTHKYNTRSKVNHVITFKNKTQIKKNMTDTPTTHIGSDYITKAYPPKDTITVEPVAHHITCETTGKILG